MMMVVVVVVMVMMVMFPPSLQPPLPWRCLQRQALGGMILTGAGRTRAR